MKHTIAVTFLNHPDTISRIAGMLSGKGFNINTISFGQSEDMDLSRMTITTESDASIVEQITKQLHKLVNVTKVQDLTEKPFIERQLALIKVFSTKSTQSEIIQLANIFRANIVDISASTITMEVTGKEEKVNASIGLLRQFGLQEISRTGSVAIKREFKNSTKAIN